MISEKQVRIALATAVREERARRRWTLRELARRTRLNPMLISRLENAENTVRISAVVRIADVLQVSMDDLLRRKNS